MSEEAKYESPECEAPQVPPMYVTLVRVHTKDKKDFTVELYSRNAEQAFFKEKGLDKLFAEQENVENVVLLGTYRRVGLEIVGKEF